ncbi:MAG: VUT family protein, partial [Firmicutes bacterium]|nr:VUT family protein [Bacillota bacterium]
MERKFSALFVIVAGAFVATLLVANVVAGRLVSVAGLALPGGVVVFPLTYLFGDVLTEVYGFRRSRLVIWTGFAANLMAVLVYAA